jgi:hypothetical protein
VHCEKYPKDRKARVLLKMARLSASFPPLEAAILRRLLVSPQEVCPESHVVRKVDHDGIKCLKRYLEGDGSCLHIAKCELALYEAALFQMTPEEEEAWAKLGKLSMQNLRLMGSVGE